MRTSADRVGLVERVLDRKQCSSLEEYSERGGGRGLVAARRLGPPAVVDEIEASGLRGRGGAGFPTGVKWRTVAAARSDEVATTVVVNGAEGEPGTFKDRALLRTNPYKVIEGALIAALAVGAGDVVVAVKGSFAPEIDALRRALAEVQGAGWAGGVSTSIVEGPGEYLFGEETGLLEVIEGRQPFPRVTPPYRRGISTDEDEGNTAADVDLVGSTSEPSPPALANNVETLASAAMILAEGADWFRSLGTTGSPGTLTCTIVGDCRRHGVGEVPMGTPLREAIELIGGGARPRARIVAAMSGVANPVITEELLDTPLSYEAMAEIGSGLGAGGFFVFDDRRDLVAVAHSASRFLAVESCGQCEPCKRDGLAIAERLRRLSNSEATEHDLDVLGPLLDRVTDGARCSLATQQQQVVRSFLRAFPEAFEARVTAAPSEAEPELVVPVIDIVEGRAILDVDHLTKQPDWTHDDTDSGTWPAAELAGEPPSIARPPQDRPSDEEQPHTER